MIGTPPTDRRDGGSTLRKRVLRLVDAIYDPFDDARATRPPKAVSRYFPWAFEGIQPAIWGLTVAAIAVGAVEVLIMTGVGGVLDRAAASAPDTFFADNAGFLGWVLFLILIARPVAMTAQGALGTMVVVPGLVTSSIWRLHRHLLGHSMRFFDDDIAGRLAQKEMQASAATETSTIDFINSFGMLLSFLVAMMATMGAADWRLGAATALWVVAYGVLLRVTLPAIRKTARERADRRAAVTGQLVDSVSNIRTVKLFAPPGAEEQATRTVLDGHRRAAMDFGLATTRMRLGLNTLNAVAITAMLTLSLWLWTSGAVTIGDSAAAAMLTLRLTAMSGWIAFTALGLFREIGTLEDALATIAPPHELTDPDDPVAAAGRTAPNRIRFEDVAFRYDRPDDSTPLRRRETALNGISLTIEQGEKVGLVGPSGAGKSTFVSLLLRLYDVTDGRITIDGVDIRAMTQSDLRARFGVVTQESALFNRSALDNIRYGRPEAGEDEAREAARRARADGFIEKLRDIKSREGFAAHLGERGVKLSGGQRQRIALARAFLKDAPVLVLDEATSALDSEVEAEVLAALQELMQDRTVIAIAHRLSTIAEMDRIVVMDQGRIVEEGDHAALLAHGGLYARLWDRQSGGFLGEAAE